MYQIKENARRVILDVITANDDSLVGLKVGHSEFISMDFPEFYELVMRFCGYQEIGNFERKLFEQKVGINREVNADGIIDCDETQLIVLETIFSDEKMAPEDYSIPRMLKLFKAEDVFSCYWLTYQNIDGRICGGGLADIVEYGHAIDHLPKKYSLTIEEKQAFPSWCENHYDILSYECNILFKQWIDTYFDSYLVGKIEQSYIMLFVILEMLFGAENNEISYQIRRGTALFLSTSRTEMIDINSQIKKLYNSRSKYVHSGKSVNWDDLFALREIVRKVIVLMYEKGYHKKDFDHKKFLDNITFGGYEPNL